MARVAWRNLSFWKKVGSNLGNVRRWRGLTDIQVSEKIGMDLKRYRKMERGETESITLKEIVNLIKFLNVVPEEIVPSIV